MAIIEREAALVTKVGSDQVLLLPYTNIANVEGGVASVNGVTPDTSGAVTIPVATASKAGTMKIYAVTGTNTDGAINQSVVTSLLNGKLSTTGTAAKATADASGNVITSTYATKTELSDSSEAAVEIAQEYTDQVVAGIKVKKITFTATDSKWGAISDGKYPLTIAANGGEFMNCYRTNGSVYNRVDVDVTVSGNNIIIYSLDKFAGYMTYL